MLTRLFGPKPKPATEFWNWFLANAGAFANPQTLAHSLVQELGNHLKAIDKGLSFEVSFPPNQMPELAISAEGDRKLFDTVRAVVAAAPAIPGWRIVAFRQPQPNIETVVLELGSISWEAATLWARAKRVGSEYDLVIWAPNYADNRMHNDALLLLLDNALGEETMGSRVQGVSFNRWDQPDTQPHIDAVRLGQLSSKIV
jgi:hypothetical protein